MRVEKGRENTIILVNWTLAIGPPRLYGVPLIVFRSRRQVGEILRTLKLYLQSNNTLKSKNNMTVPYFPRVR